LLVLFQPTNNKKQTSSRPKAAHFAAAVERSLYFVFALVFAFAFALVFAVAFAVAIVLAVVSFTSSF
jgi:hypothetical protein